MMANTNTLRTPGGALRFVSWNVKGMNSPVKRNKVFNHLTHLNTKIAFLQETHLLPSDHLKLRRGWVGQLFHSSFSSKARGVAILIHKSVPFSVTKVVSDTNGRYVIITGKIGGHNLILANVYGPNWDNDNFFKNVFFSLSDLNSHQLILAGDFNCCLDPSLDRSSNKPSGLSKSSKVIQMFMEQYAVADAWRFLNPSTKQFSFFSPVHGTFSRIDYFLIDSKLLPSVSSCSYNPIVISDHATVVVDISLPGRSVKRSPWRFNSLLLSDPNFVLTIKNRIDLFISTNVNPDTSAASIWEACKAYLRGEIISYSAYQKKINSEKSASLARDISELQSKCVDSPNADLSKELLMKKAEFDLLASNEAAESLLKSRHKYYEFGDKPSKLLAHQLRQASSSQHITQISSTDGTTIDPQVINNHFRDFYAKLYTSECVADEEKYDGFFNSLEIPSIDSATSSRLDEPFSIGELSSALMLMQSGKICGPDGLPAEFHKTFSDQLAPILLNMFNESMQNGNLPPTLRQATISLLLKKDKDPLFCGNYRPISLLCADVKLLAKMLARRLETVLPTIVGTDQTGFVKDRHSFHNVRRLFDIVYAPTPSDTPEVVISMDAEKAFDRVEWPYLFSLLKRFGFGNTFISWIRLLYTSPQACVRTNNDYSDYFPLKRGTRQGCPLSPLLFAIAIEPLAVALRSSQIPGIMRGGVEHKVSLYADDLLLFVSDLDRAFPLVLNLLEEFGQISGYKLNFQKSELMPINAAAMAYPLSDLPFKTSLEHFKYLGVCITKKYSDLYKFNFSPLLARLTQDLQRWSLLPLSLAGRINCVKMNVLPKFLYLFQCIPIFLTKRFFHSLDHTISQFLWNKKPPRIKKDTLQKPKELGGLALPNFLLYYWATNIRAMLHCCCTNDQPPPWLQVEEASCGSSSLMSLLCFPTTISSYVHSDSVVVKNCLKIWTQFKQQFTLQSIPGLAPVYSNPLFTPSIIDNAFLIWRDKGILSFNHLYIDGKFASFGQLAQAYNLPSTHFFRYLQIRDFVRNRFPNFPTIPSPTLIDTILKINPYRKGTISRIYYTLLAHQSSSSDALRTAWSADLNIEIEPAVWEHALKWVHSSSVCARHGVLQCKVVHRVHWSKSKLARIFPGVDSRCDRCHLGPASLGHMFWACPVLAPFWKGVFDTLSAVTSTNICPSPLVALFGVLPSGNSLPSYFCELVAFLSLLARRVILLHWKNPQPPSHSQWLRDALHFMTLEKIKYSLRGTSSKFCKVWEPFLDHLRSIQLDIATID